MKIQTSINKRNAEYKNKVNNVSQKKHSFIWD